jgi:Holliday junction resolvase RusA-like endonuclease
MPELAFALRGVRPVPFAGGEAEKPWWQTLATQAQAVRAKRSFPAVASSARFAVDIVFFLMPKNTPGGSDLDNLAKPVLDTLFKGRKQPPTGTLFDVHDTNVIKLTLEKRLVSTEEEEGVDVMFVWE